MPYRCWDENLKEIDLSSYNPEDWRGAWERFDTYGRKSVSEEELYMLKPLLDAKGNYNLFLSSLVEETFEWWSKGHGWYYPIYHTLQTCHCKITKVAILKIVRQLQDNALKFFISHPYMRQNPALLERRLTDYEVVFKR